MDTIKAVKRSKGIDCLFQTSVQGYEIHMGKTVAGNNVTPFIDSGHHTDGAISSSGIVFGCYLHGLFDSGTFRSKFIKHLAKMNHIQIDHTREHQDYWHIKENAYERLADHFSQYTKIDEILTIARHH